MVIIHTMSVNGGSGHQRAAGASAMTDSLSEAAIMPMPGPVAVDAEARLECRLACMLWRGTRTDPDRPLMR